jgi:hypothetical protein
MESIWLSSIPIHPDAPEEFAEQFENEWPIVVLNDGGSINEQV